MPNDAFELDSLGGAVDPNAQRLIGEAAAGNAQIAQTVINLPADLPVDVDDVAGFEILLRIVGIHAVAPKRWFWRCCCCLGWQALLKAFQLC